MSVDRVVRDGKEIILVGTAHVSMSSVEEVRRAIEEHRPDTVAVELCERRYEVLKNPGKWEETDILRIIREKKASFLFANLVLASFQKRIAEELGVKPGQEMQEAIRVAEAEGIPVALIDRPVQTTLQRAWRKLSLKERLLLVGAAVSAVFSTEKMDAEEIERIKEKDVLTAVVEEMGRTVPTVKEVLLDERDAYMARKITDLEGKRVLAVVGAGHVAGLLERLEAPPADLAELEEVPPGGRGLLKWIIPLLIVGLVVAGFFHGGAERGYEMMKWWVLSNALFAAVGAAIALAHPLTILVAAVASPITSLNPALAAGWFAGLCEAWLRRPKVADFQRLQEDILSVRGFWRNSVTRVLLVVILANVGSSVGAYAAMPVLTKIILG